MTIGAMKDRLSVKTEKRTDNGRGGWTIDEVDLGIYWGEIIPMSTRERLQFRQADKEINTTIRMRANDMITINSVFYARGNKYTIDDIVEIDGFLNIAAVGERLGQ